jgi:uncharacterized C2H2 Zn-finger protein
MRKTVKWKTRTTSFQVVRMEGRDTMLHKRCPRCYGDLYLNSDQYGRYVACAQCGHYLKESSSEAHRFSERYLRYEPQERARAKLVAVSEAF